MRLPLRGTAEVGPGRLRRQRVWLRGRGRLCDFVLVFIGEDWDADFVGLVTWALGVLMAGPLRLPRADRAFLGLRLLCWRWHGVRLRGLRLVESGFVDCALAGPFGPALTPTDADAAGTPIA